MAKAEHRAFAAPDELRTPSRSRAEVVQIGGGEVARIELQPGWRWSEDLKPVAGTEWCQGAHFQYLVSGSMHVQMADGEEFEVQGGDVVVIPPGHDAWVTGDESVIAVDWGAAAHIWGKPS